MKNNQNLQKKQRASFSTSKLVLTVLATVLLSFASYAQTAYGFGLKGGLNYNGNGDYFESATASAQHPDKSIGYHVGLFGKIGNQIYFRPEVVYTATKSEYDDDNFKMQKLDVPLLLGVKVLGPVSVFAGPSLQYVLDTKFGDVTVDDIKDDFSVGLNFGVGLNFNKVGVDLRYERGFSHNEATFINDNIIKTESRIDTRPEQLILSLSLTL
ncbi:porin family protein [Mariniflexile ostreae]|uniref:Porin family protein n=1 Tax=Mariniflexile ostreae TaxID=1520892 RepID=A0ABV5FF07_9FLAO